MPESLASRQSGSRKITKKKKTKKKTSLQQKLCFALLCLCTSSVIGISSWPSVGFLSYLISGIKLFSVFRGGRNRIGRREKWPKKSWEEGEIGGKSREEGEKET